MSKEAEVKKTQEHVNLTMGPKGFNKKIKQIRCHLAAEFQGLVANGIGVERHKVTMELWPMGVYITHQNGSSSLITYNNIKQIDFYE